MKTHLDIEVASIERVSIEGEMLSVKKLQDVMEGMLDDEIEGICLMTTEGCLLCSAFTKEDIQGTILAAVSSSIYRSYIQGFD